MYTWKGITWVTILIILAIVFIWYYEKAQYVSKVCTIKITRLQAEIASGLVPLDKLNELTEAQNKCIIRWYQSESRRALYGVGVAMLVWFVGGLYFLTESKITETAAAAASFIPGYGKPLSELRK